MAAKRKMATHRDTRRMDAFKLALGCLALCVAPLAAQTTTPPASPPTVTPASPATAQPGQPVTVAPAPAPAPAMVTAVQPGARVIGLQPRDSTADSLFRAGRIAMARNDEAKAIECFDAIATRYPQAPYAAEAMLDKAALEARQHQVTVQRDSLGRVVPEARNSDHVRSLEDAMRTLQDMTARYPTSPQIAQARGLENRICGQLTAVGDSSCVAALRTPVSVARGSVGMVAGANASQIAAARAQQQQQLQLQQQQQLQQRQQQIQLRQQQEAQQRQLVLAQRQQAEAAAAAARQARVVMLQPGSARCDVATGAVATVATVRGTGSVGTRGVVGVAVPDSLYRMGRMAMNQGDDARAIACFDVIATRYPQASFAPDALYYKAFVLSRHVDRLPAMRANTPGAVGTAGNVSGGVGLARGAVAPSATAPGMVSGVVVRDDSLARIAQLHDALRTLRELSTRYPNYVQNGDARVLQTRICGQLAVAHADSSCAANTWAAAGSARVMQDQQRAAVVAEANRRAAYTNQQQIQIQQKQQLDQQTMARLERQIQGLGAQNQNQPNGRFVAVSTRGGLGAAGDTAGCPQATENDVRVAALSAAWQIDSTRAAGIVANVLRRTDRCSLPLRRQAMVIVDQHASPALGAAVLDLARHETDPTLRRQAVAWLIAHDKDPAIARSLLDVLEH